MFNIKNMRELAGLSQQEAADGLGITKRRYGNWEREDREINLRDAIRLAQLFGCSLDELANHTAPGSPVLSPDERAVVDAMRSTDSRGRAAIARCAAGEAEMGVERPPGLGEGDVGAGAA